MNDKRRCCFRSHEVNNHLRSDGFRLCSQGAPPVLKLSITHLAFIVLTTEIEGKRFAVP